MRWLLFFIAAAMLFSDSSESRGVGVGTGMMGLTAGGVTVLAGGLLLEDGVSFLLLEDGAGNLCLEGSC